jgi:GTPase
MLKAILIDCVPPSMPKEECDHRLTEAESLIKTYGGVVLVKIVQKKLIPAYKTFIGSGKIEELIAEGKALGANILIVNNELKPHQTYNLGEIFRKENMEVWDRIDLILKIFQKHAETREARLEIELAAIKHMGPRIFGMGMQLSRQGGGIGTRGKGETNLEFMRRHLGRMEHKIKDELEACKKVRKIHRDSRKRKNLKTVGIIGYTNAGKTSLLNALTRKGAYAADKLFATLDTRVGKMYVPSPATATEILPSAVTHLPSEATPHLLPEGTTQPQPHEILISDTIGFIQDLPPALIKSFSSTLEETIDADLLLHVIDVNDPKMEQKIKVVNEILAQIDSLQKPKIYVFCKTDLLPPKSKIKELDRKYKQYHPVFVSALTKKGLDALTETIGIILFSNDKDAGFTN